MAREYEVTVTEVTGLAAGRTMLYLTAGTGTTLYIVRSAVLCDDTVADYQLIAQWNKVKDVGSPAGDITPIISKSDPFDAANEFTALGSLNTEPTSYTTPGPEVVRGREAAPWQLGARFDARDDQEPIVIIAGESWGLRVISTPPAAQKWTAKALVREIGGN